MVSQTQNKDLDDSVRLALLEEVSAAHERRITAMEDFHRDIVERLDQKIQLDATSQIQMEKALTKAVTTLEALSATVSAVVNVAERADHLAAAHDAGLKTAIKIFAVLATLGGAAWAVFTFVISRI